MGRVLCAVLLFCLAVEPSVSAHTGATQVARLSILKQRTTRTIAVTRRRIERLGSEIGTLEADLNGKERVAADLHRDILARKQQLQRHYSRTRDLSLFSALAGMPMVAAVGLIKMEEADGRLRELNSRLATIQTEQQALAEKVRAHREAKTALVDRLGRLQRAELTLVADVARVEAAIERRPRSLAQAKRSLLLSRTLLTNLRGQVRLLTSLRNSATGLGAAFDEHVRRLNAHVARAERLVEESTHAYLELVKIALARDPHAAAGRWLERRFVRRASTILAEAGLEPGAAATLAELMIPRAEAATSARFAGAVAAEMRSGEAASFVNPANLFGGTTNCGEVSLAMAHRWRGREIVALPTEPVTLEEVERIANGSFQPSSAAAAEADLLRRGHGADAIVFGRRPGDAIGHMWNLVNHHGRILHLDGQTWTTSTEPPVPIVAMMPLPPGAAWPAPPPY